MSASSEEEVRDVYAYFGRAYYFSEVILRGLCNLYALSQIPEKGGMTRPRMEEHLLNAYSFTLGKIANHVLEIMPNILSEQVQSAIDKRNFLAHHFWFERIHLISTSAGAQQLIEELTAYSEMFQQLDLEIENFSEPYYQKAGITEDTIRMAIKATMLGDYGEPIVQKRRFGKKETIVGVFDVPIDGDGTTLIFQTKDGELWQLCDGGLGWTAYSKVDSDWSSAMVFNDLLPAQINPRPRYKVPWHYEIDFGRGVTLVVRPGSQSSQFQWSIRRRES